jgi:hypothetical protein
MHAKLVATVEFNGKISKSFEIENGIRQGDVLVPLIFLLVINPILEVITQKCKGYKAKFSNLAISVLAYMDNIIIISDNLDDFNFMCQIITEILEYMDMQVNKTKTYFLTNQKDEKLRFKIGGHEIQPVPKNTSVEYLSYWININGDDGTNNKIKTSSTVAKLNN